MGGSLHDVGVETAAFAGMSLRGATPAGRVSARTMSEGPGIIDCVPGFDITSILDFQPPRYICPACRGLMPRIATDYKVRPFARWCPVCQVKFVADSAEFSGARSGSSDIYDGFSQQGLSITRASSPTQRRSPRWSKSHVGEAAGRQCGHFSK